MAGTRRGLTLWHVVATLPWIVAVLVARSKMGDNSFLWHITAGRLQADAGSVLTADPFSLGRTGGAWRTQSWLADVLYAWADSLTGLSYVPWLRGVMAGLLFVAIAGIVFSIARSIPVTAVAVFLAALLAVPFLNPRPVIFSYLFLALLVLADRSVSLRWTIPPLFYVWASVHGSWVIGAVYLALRVLEMRDYRRIRNEAPFVALAVLVTAHGWGVFDYLRAFGASGQALELISEWAPPDLISIARAPFTIGLVVILVGATRGKITTRQVIFLLPLLWLGLSSSRSVLPVFILILPILALALGGLERFFTRPLRGIAVVLAAIVVLPFVLDVDGGLDTARFPVDLVARAEGSTLFHDDVVGGYIIYSAWPRIQPLVDDRAELYGEDLVEFVQARSGAPSWKEYFDEYEFDLALVREEQAITQVLQLSGWETVGTSGDGPMWRLLSAPSE